ncbi:hypothetical protein [Tomitella cavernea]|uniref:hypothetical protein n=1 Tax=Tomitella cavernea TaxID=1387982 RepID=UPI0031E4F74D
MGVDTARADTAMAVRRRGLTARTSSHTPHAAAAAPTTPHHGWGRAPSTASASVPSQDGAGAHPACTIAFCTPAMAAASTSSAPTIPAGAAAAAATGAAATPRARPWPEAGTRS